MMRFILSAAGWGAVTCVSITSLAWILLVAVARSSTGRTRIVKQVNFTRTHTAPAPDSSRAKKGGPPSNPKNPPPNQPPMQPLKTLPPVKRIPPRKGK